jgi:branched-chain amino acid aminotransferase
LLEGITRDTVFKLADRFKITVDQRPVDRSELYVADEIFLCGSSMNISPVISVDHRKIGSGKTGPLTKKLTKAYDSCGRREDNFFTDWTTPAIEANRLTTVL